ncbi:MAG: hypothetical protein ABL915_08280 [Gallionella sp.]
MRLLFLGLCLFASNIVAAEPALAIIANHDGDYATLTRRQVVDIYMGKLTVLNNGTFPQPVDYQGNPEIRERFYRLMTGKNLAQINAYWARMSFTGQANPTRLLPDQKAMLRAVGKNQDALGFVDKDEVTPSVKSLMIIE